MKLQDKKTKKKEDIRNLILNAAKKLFVEEGFNSTSIRKIANEIGYSPTTIYLYYKDKNDIIHALHQEGFSLLRTLLFSLQTVENPFERLKAIGRTYIKFAVEHPDFYEVMFLSKSPLEFIEKGDGCWTEGNLVFDLLTNTIQECQKLGYFKGGNTDATALHAWSTAHGLCSLYISTHLKHIGEERFNGTKPENLIEDAYKTYVNLIDNLKNENQTI